MLDGKEEKIRMRAHEIWEAEGRPEGREKEHWDRAAREIEQEGSRSPAAGNPSLAAMENPAGREGGMEGEVSGKVAGKTSRPRTATREKSAATREKSKKPNR